MTNIKDVHYHINIFNDLINIFPLRIKNSLSNIPNEIKFSAQEIRVNKTVVIICPNEILQTNISISKEDLTEIFNFICCYSVYSFQEQLKNGFITFKGGHRIGIASSAVIENGNIVAIKDITSFNVRIAKEFKGCSKKILPLIKDSSTLIVGSPCSGKTTILRDLARILSESQKVTIVDERSEISAAFDGSFQMDIGTSDVLVGFPKSIGILRAVRCLSPNFVICDEIGSLNEAKSMKECLNSGVKIIASIHAKDEFELLKKPQVVNLFNMQVFQKIVILENSSIPGKLSKIINVDDLCLK